MHPFRGSSDAYDTFMTWAFFGGIACAFVGFIFLLSWCDDERKIDCERKGGQYVHVYKSSLCVKPGSVIE